MSLFPKKRCRDTTLRLRLTRAMIVLSALSVALSCVVFLLWNVMEARRQLDAHMESVTGMLAYSLRGAVAFHDRELATRLLIAVVRDEQVVRAEVEEVNGVMLAEFPLRQSGGRSPTSETPKGLRDEACCAMSASVVLDGDVLGRVRVTYSLHTLHLTIRRYAMLSVMVMALCLSFASLLAYRMQQRISAPLLRLAQWVKQLSEDRDFTRRAPRETHDEIATVVDGLNELLQQIQSRDASLQESGVRLQEHRERLRSLAFELEAAAEVERRSLAADLHDSVCQLLWGAKLSLAAVQRDVAGTSTGTLLDQVAQSVHRALAETRTLTFQLCPRHLYDLGLETALQEIPEAMEMDGVAFRFSSPGLPEDIQDTLSILVYRSVQELVRNVLKHAKASETVVEAAVDDGILWVSVADDGIGADASHVLRPDASTRGFGLFSIMERLRSVGGALEVEARKPRGTVFTLRAPYAPTNLEVQ